MTREFPRLVRYLAQSTPDGVHGVSRGVSRRARPRDTPRADQRTGRFVGLGIYGFRQRQLSPVRIRSRALSLSFVFNDHRQGLPQRRVADRLSIVRGRCVLPVFGSGCDLDRVGMAAWHPSQPRTPGDSLPSCSTVRVLVVMAHGTERTSARRAEGRDPRLL